MEELSLSGCVKAERKPDSLGDREFRLL